MLITFAGCVRSAVGHLLDLRVANAVSLVATRLLQLAQDPTLQSIRVHRAYLRGHADARALAADCETSPFPVHLVDQI